MRKILRYYAITWFGLWLAKRWFPGGLVIIDGTEVLFEMALVLTIANLLVRPVVNILLLPFNLITLGAFRWVVNALMLWLTMKFVPGVAIAAFTYPGINWSGFIIPEFHLSVVGAYLYLSFFMSLTGTILFWLFR